MTKGKAQATFRLYLLRTMQALFIWYRVMMKLQTSFRILQGTLLHEKIGLPYNALKQSLRKWCGTFGWYGLTRLLDSLKKTVNHDRIRERLAA